MYVIINSVVQFIRPPSIFIKIVRNNQFNQGIIITSTDNRPCITMNKSKSDKKKPGDSEVDIENKQNKNKSSTETITQNKRAKTNKNVNEELKEFNNPDNGKKIVLTGASLLDNAPKKSNVLVQQGKSIII